MTQGGRDDIGAGALRRDLGLRDAVAVGLGAILGAGIFVVTGLAARVAGPAFVVGLALAGVAAACNALASAQLAATFPVSGGTYEYAYRVLGPSLGFAAGWLFLVSKLAAGATVALGLGAAVEAAAPAVEGRAVAVAATAALTAANALGIRKAGRLNTLVVGITVLVLLTFVVAGLPSFRAANLRPFAPAGWRGVLEAAGLLFFAYTGYARVATLGEEVRDPRRTIPRAIVLALAGSLLLYLAVSVVAVGAIGAEAMGRSASPLQTAAAEFGPRAIAPLVAFGAATALLGVLLSQLFGISRMMFAMGRRGDLPRTLERVEATRGVPRVAVFLAGTLVAGLALVATLEEAVGTATSTILVYYAITNAAALRMPAEGRLYPRWVPVLGLVLCALLGVAHGPVLLGGGALLLAGFALRRALRR